MFYDLRRGIPRFHRTWHEALQTSATTQTEQQAAERRAVRYWYEVLVSVLVYRTTVLQYSVMSRAALLLLH